MVFSWMLGVSLACGSGILNAMWYELKVDRAKGAADRS